MLTAHFSLREMCASGTAIRLGIKNEPSEEVINRLQQLCENSQHRLGEAADIHVSNIEVGRKMFRYIKENLEFDQLLFERIQENGACWLHVSYKNPSPNPSRGRGDKNRRQAIDNYVVPPRAEELQWEY